ncbi:MAG: DUF6152 family protein [Acidobacteriota bacterium]
MRKQTKWILFVAALASLTPLLAHHGTAASYDQKVSVTLKGTVTEFLWRNPHCSLFIAVKQDNGKVENYSIEMFSPSLMAKRGYTRNVLKTGDQVEMDVHPSLAGTPSGECLGCRLIVNGKNPAGDQAGKQAKGKGK